MKTKTLTYDLQVKEIKYSKLRMKLAMVLFKLGEMIAPEIELDYTVNESKK